MSREVVDEVIKLFDEKKIAISKELMEQIAQQAILCGQVTIKFIDDGTFEIVNPFKGCECGTCKREDWG